MNKTIGVFTLLLLTTASIGGAFALEAQAHQEVDKRHHKPFGLVEDEAVREQIKQAIADNDYNTWESLMQEQINENNFDRLVERHDAIEEYKTLRADAREAWETGDYDTLDSIRTELETLREENPNARGWNRFFGWMGGSSN